MRVAPDEVLDIDQPAGACFVMRRSVWATLGGFDESFFLWYEDVDLARRVADAGLRRVIVGAAEARHIAGDSVRRVDRATSQAMRLRSLHRYVELHHHSLLRLAEPVFVLATLLRLGRGASARRRRGELLRGPQERRWMRLVAPDQDAGEPVDVRR